MELDFWHMMCVDMEKLENGKTSYSFFQDGSNDNSESIRDIENEQEVVKFVFTHHSLKDFVIGKFVSDTGRYKIALNVTTPLIESKNEKPGDIDVLLIPYNNESETIAIEVKCFKALTQENKTTIVNKAEKVANSFKQVNGYEKLGFHKIFFAIILLDDARNDATPNSLLKSTKNDKIANVFWHQNFNSISNSIGIAFIHISQTTNKSYTQSLTAKLKVKRDAIPQNQNLRTTERIKQLLNE